MATKSGLDAYREYKLWVNSSSAHVKYINRVLSASDNRGVTKRLHKVDKRADQLIIDMYNLFKALGNKGFNREFRKKLRNDIDNDFKDIIFNLRNIKVHWELSKKYFNNSDTIVNVPNNRDTRSIRWYIEKFPDKYPWGFEYNRENGYVFSGAVSLYQLQDELKKIKNLIKKYTKTYDHLGIYRVRY